MAENLAESTENQANLPKIENGNFPIRNRTSRFMETQATNLIFRDFVGFPEFGRGDELGFRV